MPLAPVRSQLRSQYNGEIEEYDKIVNEFKNMLEKENKIFIPVLIDYDYIPKDISSDDMNIIWNLIDRQTIPDHLIK